MTTQLTLRQQVDQMKPEFNKVLPGHITADRFVRTAQTAIALTRNIERIKDPKSLMAAVTKAAADGLILDGREAALVIDYNGEAQYRPMMRGLLKLAYNSGQIKSVVVETVRDEDVFEYEPTDPDNPLTHRIKLKGERGDVYAVYAKATLKDGGIIHEVMTIADVNAIRDRSDAYRAFKAGKIKSTPWSTDWSEMARKTVFRRLSKYLPSSTDKEDRLSSAAERIDEDYTFAEEVVPAPQIEAPKRVRASDKLKAAPEPVQEPEADADGVVEHISEPEIDDSLAANDSEAGDEF